MKKFTKIVLAVEKKVVRKSGVVTELLPNATFRVRLDDGKEILCHLAGKLRRYRIKIVVGDKVNVELGPYDNQKGRIVYREK